MKNRMFNPGKFLPHAYLVRTQKGKDVYRIRMNIDEILSRLEENKKHMCIDIPAKNGVIQYASGNNNGSKPWKAITFYAWAVEDGNGHAQRS